MSLCYIGSVILCGEERGIRYLSLSLSLSLSHTHTVGVLVCGLPSMFIWSSPLDCSTLPLIRTLSKEASSTIFLVFGMTPPGIEPWSPGPLANTRTARLMSGTKESRLIYGPFVSTLLDQRFPVEHELDACNPPLTRTFLYHPKLLLCLQRRVITLIPGQPFLETFMSLSYGNQDHTFMGDYITVLKQQTRLLLCL